MPSQPCDPSPTDLSSHHGTRDGDAAARVAVALEALRLGALGLHDARDGAGGCGGGAVAVEQASRGAGGGAHCG